MRDLLHRVSFDGPERSWIQGPHLPERVEHALEAFAIEDGAQCFDELTGFG